MLQVALLNEQQDIKVIYELNELLLKIINIKKLETSNAKSVLIQ